MQQAFDPRSEGSFTDELSDRLEAGGGDLDPTFFPPTDSPEVPPSGGGFPTVKGQTATAFVDDSGTLLGAAFGGGSAYSGEIFTNTDDTGTPNDVVQGTGGNDNIWTGTQGSDLIVGLGGNDIIGLGTGNVQVEAGSGNDTAYSISGGGGNNAIALGGGDNIVWVENGSYAIETEGGNDIIGLGTGTDSVDAGDGDNIIYMVDVSAGGAKDILTGSSNDYVALGSGDDFIDAGAGLNTLYGRGGSDRFVFRSGAYNFVADFENSVDRLELSGLDRSSLSFYRGTGNVAADAFVFVGDEVIGQVANITVEELNSSVNFA